MLLNGNRTCFVVTDGVLYYIRRNQANQSNSVLLTCDQKLTIQSVYSYTHENKKR